MLIVVDCVVACCIHNIKVGSSCSVSWPRLAKVEVEGLCLVDASINWQLLS